MIFYLWFAYEFCLFTITCQAKHRLEFREGESFDALKHRLTLF
ncbi:hypothetical protein HMPREF9554_00240 [Treponema phagedenis F0421]|nr:hypothetical protein HMPREF9554_00240 [Treponema phagedenis F0421]